MKYRLILLLGSSGTIHASGQQINSISDIDKLVAQINRLKVKSHLQLAGNITYALMSDMTHRKLCKVVVNDSSYKKTSDYYYYHNDQLIFIESAFGRYYFRDHDFTQATSNWKDDNDLSLLQREKQIAIAYRFFIMHKKSQESNPKTN